MKVLIADSYPLIRKGLISTLSLGNIVKIVKEVSTANEAIRELLEFNPDITIVELRIGKEDGLEIVNKAKSQNIKSKFIVMTSSLSKEEFLRVKEAGAEGYILRYAPIEDIAYAFSVVTRGGRYYDPEVLQMQFHKSLRSNLNSLTEREKEVLMELKKGLSNTKIAQNLYISENTVKKHISNILLKLDLNHRIEAALLANDLFSNIG